MFSFYKTGAHESAPLGEWGLYYWHLDYSHGFIKRSLIGAIFQGIVHDQSDATIAKVLQTHAVTFWVFVSIMAVLFSQRVLDARERSERTNLIGLGVLFFLSPLVSGLGYTIGFVDIFLFLFFIIAVSLFRQKHYFIGVLVATTAPFIHEGFVFLWGGFIFILFIDWLLEGRPKSNIYLVFLACLPIIADVCVVCLSDHTAANLTIDAFPFGAGVKNILKEQQFGFSVMETLQVNHDRITHNPVHYLLLLIYSTLPAFALAAYSFFHPFYRAHRMLIGLRCFIPVFLTLLITFVGYDWSRLMSWTCLTASVVLLFPPMKSEEELISVKKPDMKKYPAHNAYKIILAAMTVCYFFWPSLWLQDRWERDGIKINENYANYSFLKESIPDKLLIHILNRS